MRANTKTTKEQAMVFIHSMTKAKENTKGGGIKVSNMGSTFIRIKLNRKSSMAFGRTASELHGIMKMSLIKSAFTSINTLIISKTHKARIASYHRQLSTDLITSTKS